MKACLPAWWYCGSVDLFACTQPHRLTLQGCLSWLPDRAPCQSQSAVRRCHPALLGSQGVQDPDHAAGSHGKQAMKRVASLTFPLAQSKLADPAAAGSTPARARSLRPGGGKPPERMQTVAEQSARPSSGPAGSSGDDLQGSAEQGGATGQAAGGLAVLAFLTPGWQACMMLLQCIQLSAAWRCAADTPTDGSAPGCNSGFLQTLQDIVLLVSPVPKASHTLLKSNERSMSMEALIALPCRG